MSIEQRVRDLAAELHKAIKAAEAAGYRILWPHHVDRLPSIAISETAAAAKPAEPAPANDKPAATPAPKITFDPSV